MVGHGLVVRDYGFVHIPKCGGTSIRRVLGSRKHIKGWKHPNARVMRDHLGPDAILFTQVRNPYPRMVSLYFQIMGKLFKHLDKNKLPPETAEWFREGGFRQWLLVSHEVYPLRFEDGPLPMNLLPQSYWYEGCDVFFRLEDQDIWKFLRKKVGLPCNRRVLNQGRYGKWKDYYDDECRKFVARTFEEEIERFKYGFDRP